MPVLVAIVVGGVVIYLAAILAGQVGQLLWIAAEFTASSFDAIGVHNPVVAWTIMGILIGGIVGMMLGMHRAGRRYSTRQIVFVVGTTIALMDLVAWSNGPPSASSTRRSIGGSIPAMDSAAALGVTLVSQMDSAIEHGDVAAVRRLALDRSSLVPTAPTDFSPLMIAAQKGDGASVQVLLAAGADPKYRTSRADDSLAVGATAVTLAVLNNHVEIVQILVRSGGDPNSIGTYGGRVLDDAMWAAHDSVVQVLLGAGAPQETTGIRLVAAAAGGYQAAVAQALAAGVSADASARRKNPTTALMAAASRDRIDVVRQLIQAHASLENTNEDGLTALGVAAEAGHADVVTILLAAGAKTGGTAGQPALHGAARGGFPEIALQLLTAGADPQLRFEGATAAELANTLGHPDVAEAIDSTMKKQGTPATMPISQAGPFVVSQVDEPVRQTGCPQPIYPPALRANGVQGDVTLRYVIGTDGRVEPASTQVVSSSNRAFENPAIVAVTNCAYKPATIANVAVRQLVEQNVKFSLGSGPAVNRSSQGSPPQPQATTVPPPAATPSEAAAAELYRSGRFPEALGEYRAVAATGNAQAEGWVGWMLWKGIGTVPDPVEARRWFERSADAGNMASQKNLGDMFREGAGGPKNASFAQGWYQRAFTQYMYAAQGGDASAQTILATLYQRGYGIRRDESAAVEWFRKAAQQGYAAGQRDLGFTLLDGNGVRADRGEAIRWFRTAARQGDQEAQQQLRSMGVDW